MSNAALVQSVTDSAAGNAVHVCRLLRVRRRRRHSLLRPTPQGQAEGEGGSSVCIMCVMYEPSPARSTIISTVSDGRASGAVLTTSSAFLRGPSARRDAMYQRHRSQEQYIRVRRQQRASTVNAPSVDRSVRRRPTFRAAIDVSMYSISLWSKQPPLGERRHFMGHRTTSTGGHRLHSSRADAATHAHRAPTGARVRYLA